MARWSRVGGMRRMNLPAADPQLELSVVELRPTVQKLRTQHLLIPFSAPLSIADLDIDVLYHRNPGHGCTSLSPTLRTSYHVFRPGYYCYQYSIGDEGRQQRNACPWPAYDASNTWVRHGHRRRRLGEHSWCQCTAVYASYS